MDVRRRRGCAQPHSDDVEGQSALGRATNSRRAYEIGTAAVSGDSREIHASSAHSTVANLAHVPRESRLAHERRRVVHVAVTAYPTAAWTAQQLREAFPWDESPWYLVHDRDTAFEGWATTAKAIGIDEVITAAHSPWQNAYAERLIGSIRRECVDHMIVANERGLRRVLHAYVDDYLKSRTHVALGKDARPHDTSRRRAIVAIPHLSGLHHRYERRAA